MTEAKLRALFKLWQGRLGLQHWELKIRVQPCSTENHAIEVSRNRYYPRATITVQPWLLSGEVPPSIEEDAANPVEVERSIVHELLHCAVAPMNRINNLYEEHLHPNTQLVVGEAAYAAGEATVDALADALVRAFGQQTLTKPKRKKK
jgi:hypothetical protein